MTSTPPAAARASAVTLTDVSVTFRLADGTRYMAVERASLAVADGEFVAIVGPTGCGKSTLLNVAAGLLAPSGGASTIFGAPLAGLNRQAGYLFQAEALFPWKTALENVAIGLETAGTPKSEARGAPSVAHPRRARWLRRALSAHALGRTAQARRAGAGADPRSEDPADGRAVRPARCADPADHGQPAARSVERRPQGGDVRHPRPGGSDRAVRPRRHHVGGPAARIIGDWQVPLARPRDIAEVKLERAFHELHREIWQTLKDEVMKGYAQTGGG